MNEKKTEYTEDTNVCITTTWNEIKNEIKCKKSRPVHVFFLFFVHTRRNHTTIIKLPCLIHFKTPTYIVWILPAFVHAKQQNFRQTQNELLVFLCLFLRRLQCPFSFRIRISLFFYLLLIIILIKCSRRQWYDMETCEVTKFYKGPLIE